MMRSVIVLMLSVILPVMTTVAAESHVIPVDRLHRDAATASETRQMNLVKAEQFFGSEIAQKALGGSKINGEQVKKAIPLLSDEELSRLASRADAAQAAFAAGSLSNEHLTYIVIALATAVIILVIVEAK
jgi:hypothetical protein